MVHPLPSAMLRTNLEDETGIEEVIIASRSPWEN
jgi:hypothetical protein